MSCLDQLRSRFKEAQIKSDIGLAQCDILLQMGRNADAKQIVQELIDDPGMCFNI